MAGVRDEHLDLLDGEDSGDSMDLTSVDPVRVGARVIVRPLLPSDYEWVYKTSVCTPSGYRWRLHGETPTYENFLTLLLQNARCTYLILSRSDDQPAGMVQLWNLDAMALTGHLTAFTHPDFIGKAWPFEGLLLFADYIFAVYRLRKLYIEALEGELTQFGSGRGHLFREEGVLRQHRYVANRLVDYHILALYREDLGAVLETTLGRRSLLLRSMIDSID